MTIDMFQHELESPLGLVLIVTEGATLRSVDFEDYRDRRDRLLARHYGGVTFHHAARPNDAVQRIRDYLAGDMTATDQLAVATNGTPFQQSVWKMLRAIPAGTTASYGQVAARIGSPGASRAVGLANGSNPIAIVVPCHRVVGADRSLTGYGGGLERKRWLLRHEGIDLAGPRPVSPKPTPKPSGAFRSPR